MIPSTKKTRSFIRIFLILISNVLYGNMILYKEYINIDTEVSNLRSINNNRTLITYEVIFFITKDSYMYGAENISLKTIKEKKTKNKLTKIRLKKT